MFCTAFLYAQAPANDRCENAYEIMIPGGGYNLGTYSSARSKLQGATTQSGEYFSSSFINNGLQHKTIWYKFTTTVTRSITIELKQRDTVIAQNSVGLRVYRTNACLPDSARSSQEFAPIPNFGNTGNTCVAPGTYYLQVCAAQSAGDSVWIDLVIAQPGPAPYDERTNAYRFGIANKSLSVSAALGCYSKSSPDEVCTSIGPDYHDYTQTVWFTFETPNAADYLMIDGSAYQTIADAGYKVGFNLFKGDARNSSETLIAVDTGRVFNRSAFYKVFECSGLQRATVYSVQLFFHKNAASALRIDILGASADSARSANPRTLPANYRLGSGFFSKTTEDFISCNALLSRNMCGSVTAAPAFIAPLPSNAFKSIDTFEYGYWITFGLPQKGAVTTSVWMTDTNNIINVINGTTIYRNKYYVIRFFKGNVYTNCNLQPVSTDILNSYYKEFCLDSGEYSMQILFSGRNTSGTSVKDYLLFGKKFRLDLMYERSVDQRPGLYDAPSKAENLGNVNAAPGQNVVSTIDYFGGSFDNRLIGGVYTGKNSSYREFYLAERSYVKILDSNSFYDYTSGYYTYLFRGSASANLNAVTMVPVQYGSNPFLRSSVFGVFQSNSCTPLDPGWYTIVSTVSLSCINSSDTLKSRIQVSVIPTPQANYDKPYKAYMFNNGNPVSFSANTGTPDAPVHRRAITLPAGCFGCEADPVSQLCNPSPAYRNALYYVINIAEECQLFLRPNIAFPSYLLYRLNVKTDSLKLNNAANIIRPCSGGNEFCRLQPGYYTLVIMDQPGCRTSGYSLILDKVMYSAYDHAYNSGDLGVIPATGNVVSSPLDVVSCTTGHSITDPKSTGTYTTYPIPPDRLKQRSTTEIDNNWFTFSASGTGTIKVRTLVATSALSGYKPLFNVYRTNAPGYLTMQQLRDRGELDSSIAMGLTRIAGNPANSNEVVFSQNTCDTIRYFIVVDRIYSEYNYHIQTEVEYSGQSNAREGDYCSNAVAFSANNTGTVSGTAAITCHTIGESYGEDGSNMDCLFDGPGYKSTWFKFTLNRSQKTDLSFSLENQTNASSQQIRYRILYGSCDAMNPGPCVETALSTFRLDCMLPGDYYIQVVSPATAMGSIKANVIVANSPFPSCKATSPFQPLAKFIFGKEKCNTDTFAFKNLSSAGSQISYFWDFGNGITSTDKAPLVPFVNNNSIDTYYVKLRVHNTFYDLYDSIILPLYASKDSTWLDAGSSLYAQINTGVPLHAITNVTGATFKWSPVTGLNDANKQDPVSTGNQHQLYEVTMTHKLCTYKDSVMVYRYTHDSTLISSQKDFCIGLKDTIRLDTKPLAGKYEWSTGDTTAFIRVTEPGTYHLKVSAPGLFYLDTIRLIERSLQVPLLGNDTSFCKYSSLVVKVNGTFSSYAWSTGETTNAISIDSSAAYIVTVNDHQCLFSDTIVVSRTDIAINAIPDTIMCPGYGNLELTAGNGFDAYLWSTGDVTEQTIVHYPGQYTLKLSRNGCFEFDTIDVKAKPIPFTPLADTVICKHDSLILFAGIHDGYLWFNADTSAFTTIYTPGTFTLRIRHEACYLYDTFTVNPHPVKLSLPADTFYCRHNSVVLDAGPGYDSYLWSTGETQRSITISSAGAYFIRVKQEQCAAYDTVTVSMLENKPLLKDTTICPDTRVELHAGVRADQYLWSTGETTPAILTGDPGTYMLIVSTKGCKDSASSVVSKFSTQRIFELKDTTVCKPFQVILSAGSSQSIVWFPGGETYDEINAMEYGEYIAVKKDMNGCMVSDTFHIFKDCGPSALYVPNAFTLNGDGINDVFKASAFEVTDFTIRVYNRWGQEVFKTDDPAKGWDGNYNNQPAPVDVYLWIINYRDNKGILKTASGNVTLLR